MSLKSTVLSSIDLAVAALGDLVMDGQRAIIRPQDHIPGAIQTRQFDVSEAIVALTVADVKDFPGTSIEVFDKSLMDIKPLIETNPGAYYRVGERTFVVVQSKHTYAGDVLALSQHLVRPEKVSGVTWL